MCRSCAHCRKQNFYLKVGGLLSVERSLLHDHSTESVDGWSTLSGRMVSVERSLFNLCDHSTESVERSQKCTNVDSTDSVESTSSFPKCLNVQQTFWTPPLIGLSGSSSRIRQNKGGFYFFSQQNNHYHIPQNNHIPLSSFFTAQTGALYLIMHNL